ncbi:fatty-acid amide hydrolase, putative [Talaromyces stipitatus ATCC 10500]|uniref:Fatty-acid amide hydrolase, putative n=1 Tax=Talaromyces stipitatus (strain ATCC 10500 / CBS 375.48 / QM 6759 / NRRL 1006) TaxID=441959 RepID=B8MMB0_TALSN|nr:fatty-acid amide hydrolase, putative [Talaromyces stipitatus ATCC 10500]EED13664.1 fatty-acid amide hydrolase, putative [Talaromyces stipitatus ATCC 10500]
MTQTTWQKVEIKIFQAKNNIPLEWRLPSSYLEVLQDACQSVLGIPHRCGILSEMEIHVTEAFDETALFEKPASRGLTAVEVTTAFCKRAAIAHQLTYCLTETFFDTALRRARELDDHLEATGKTTGPLHGLPISVKECYNIAVGFKPSASQVPYGNIGSAARLEMARFLPCAGSLSHTVRDVELLLRVVLNSNAADLDDNALGVPWNATRQRPSLRAGVLPEDALYRLASSNAACSEKCSDQHFKADVIHLRGKDLAFRFFNMNPDRTALSHVKNGDEPFIPSLKSTYDLDKNAPEPQLLELYQLNVSKAKLLTRMRQVFVENKVDPVSYHSEGQMHLKTPNLSETFRTRRSEVEGAPCHIQLTGKPMRDEDLIQDALIVEKVLQG